MFAITGGVLAGAVFVGAVQGYVSYAVYRIWPISPPIPHRYVAYNVINDLRCHLLRPIPRSCY